MPLKQKYFDVTRNNTLLKYVLNDIINIINILKGTQK